MEKISATIITLNEEDNIKDCILSLQEVCDEIIVIDSLSTDNTVKIAKENGAIVYLQEYLGDGPQKKLGAKHAKNNWILCLDADERLEDNCKKKILNLKLKHENIAYAFRRKNFVGNHWIKAAGLYPNYVTRLYNRKTSGYNNKKGHSEVITPKIKKIKANIIHYTYNDYSHWLERLNWFSTRDAWIYYEKGKKPNKYRPIISAFSAFVKKFIINGGIFQGVDGATVTLTAMVRAYMKYIKLNEIYEKQKNKS